MAVMKRIALLAAVLALSAPSANAATFLSKGRAAASIRNYVTVTWGPRLQNVGLQHVSTQVGECISQTRWIVFCLGEGEYYSPDSDSDTYCNAPFKVTMIDRRGRGLNRVIQRHDPTCRDSSLFQS